jgi:hypothetical protein
MLVSQKGRCAMEVSVRFTFNEHDLRSIAYAMGKTGQADAKTVQDWMYSAIESAVEETCNDFENAPPQEA